ncbi:MAG: hypothetical protein QOJ42_2514 [Acidobacteriaceae bacterium]|nr:hypothetical protein [Acidobacteriaceae bacterium]
MNGRAFVLSVLLKVQNPCHKRTKWTGDVSGGSQLLTMVGIGL